MRSQMQKSKRPTKILMKAFGPLGGGGGPLMVAEFYYYPKHGHAMLGKLAPTLNTCKNLGKYGDRYRLLESHIKPYYARALL